MFYVNWTRCELATLTNPALYTEVDEDGWVQRELAVTDDGTVAEQLVPTTKKPEFETLWQSGAGRVRKT